MIVRYIYEKEVNNIKSRELLWELGLDMGNMNGLVLKRVEVVRK